MIYKTTKGKGKHVVILHGWSCNHHHMQPVVDMLADRFQVTNVDLPGCGQSHWEPHIKTIHDMAEVLLPHLPEKAIYVGWSFGGLVAMSLAANHPERVSHFIGIATTPKFVEEAHWPGIPQPGFKPFFAQITPQSLRAFFLAFYDAEFSGFDPKPAEYHKLIDILDSSKIDIPILLKGIDIVDTADLREEFKSLRCPIDLILSEKDDSVPKAVFEKIRQLNPRVHIHPIPDAHHMPFWTHAKQVQKILKTILP